MTYAEGTRRSKRLAAKPKTTVEPKSPFRSPIQKKRTASRRSSRKTAPKPKAKVSKASAAKATAVPAQPVERVGRSRPQLPRIRTSVTTLKLPKRPTPLLIEDTPSSDDEESGDPSDEQTNESSEESSEESSADEFSMEDSTEEDSDDEINEQSNLSYDQIELHHSHKVSGSQYSSQSYDSRFELGNRGYEADDFVIDDDESIVEESDMSDQDSDLDLEINMDRDPVRTSYRNVGRPVRVGSLFSNSDRRTSTSNQSSRSRSTRYPSSGSSRLFFSDLSGTSKVSPYLPSWANLGFQTGDEASEAPLIAQASAEVVEEIVDALALFSRRINYHRSPIRLRLAAAVLDDKEIREALEDAIRTGLGRKLSFPDGSKQWTIGPRRR